uniref:Uncharacterized protein n=1 Tax=viral metagenome TaxID=1070528 RepID=A0A6C0BRU1_9ZZZZ
MLPKSPNKEVNKSKKDCKITATNFTECIRISSEKNEDPIILCDDVAIKYLDCMLSLEKK